MSSLPLPCAIDLQSHHINCFALPRQDRIDDVPLYAHVKEVQAPAVPAAPAGHVVVEALEINYLTFYAFNGAHGRGADGCVFVSVSSSLPCFSQLSLASRAATSTSLGRSYTCCLSAAGPYNVGGVRLVQTGQHDGDWEHVTARQARLFQCAHAEHEERCLLGIGDGCGRVPAACFRKAAWGALLPGVLSWAALRVASNFKPPT